MLQLKYTAKTSLLQEQQKRNRNWKEIILETENSEHLSSVFEFPVLLPQNEN